MIRSALKTLAGCALCVPLMISAVRYEVNKAIPKPQAPEHDIQDVREDIGEFSDDFKRSTNLKTRVSRASGRSADLGKFEITNYDLRGIDLARKQIARGLEKRKARRHRRDQSFEGLRDVIRESSDGEIRRYMSAVNRLERAMENRDRSDQKDYVEGFIRDFAPLALYLEEETGLPASVMMAQIIVESGWGASNITILKNNVLGIGNCRDQGEFVAQVDFEHADREIRVRCMADTTAYRFDSVGDGILYYTYLLLENESNEKHYGALRSFIRKNRRMAEEEPKAYRNRVIELISRGYHADPDWYEDYLRRVVRIVERTKILPEVEESMTMIADARMWP